MTSSEKANSYSRNWFEFFHLGIDEARTNREVEFICRCVPRPEFQRILDVCCGMGRHARAFSARGYTVTAIDRDPAAIEKARELGGGSNYIIAEIREYQPPRESFDAVIVMGQSFGHFDEATNHSVLFRLASSVRDGGRVILDLWNPAFFSAHQSERELRTARGNVCELKKVDCDRLFVQLDYPDGVRERFEWQLFSPEQMERAAKAAGLFVVAASSGFDARNLPSRDDPRIQFVLER